MNKLHSVGSVGSVEDDGAITEIVICLQSNLEVAVGGATFYYVLVTFVDFHCARESRGLYSLLMDGNWK